MLDHDGPGLAAPTANGHAAEGATCSAGSHAQPPGITDGTAHPLCHTQHNVST